MRLDRVHTFKLSTIIREENLRPDQTHAFVNVAFRDGAIQTTGTAITSVLPPASRFFADGGHGEKKQRVLPKLAVFFEQFFGLSSGGGDDGTVRVAPLTPRWVAPVEAN